MAIKNNDYAWLITYDHLDAKPAAIHGPRGAVYTPAQIKNGGKAFRLYDDDGELYFSGVYLGPNDESMFGPLDDYGMPVAGATRIEYLDVDEAGTWSTL